MFDKNRFSEILKNIYNTYDNQRLFAEATGVNRGYLSRYINKKIDSPPSPKILKGIADASKGITTYEELMKICGHVTEKTFGNNSMVNNNISVITIFEFLNGKKQPYNDLWIDKSILEPSHQYFAFKTNDDSMLPLLGKGDIAIIEKSNSYQNGNTCLISIDNDILIRKIVDFKDYIELYTAIPYSQPTKITNEEKTKNKFKVLGKVIRVENSSAFK